ncbi:hypothetical protein [Roseicella aerolata]|uniref:Uncharacterized protein n=1 Tax=Roseicella aerolata TaxID=2883479 RepID=A0A9X1L7A9_9PROT|nr:hypothetical protein [Roseicella aerolata]MCB4821756.1 hypothetical protein [Roseicella aerolata]
MPGHAALAVTSCTAPALPRRDAALPDPPRDRRPAPRPIPFPSNGAADLPPPSLPGGPVAAFMVSIQARNEKWAAAVDWAAAHPNMPDLTGRTSTP